MIALKKSKMNFLDRFDKKHIDGLSLEEGLVERPETGPIKLEVMQRISKMYQKLKKDDKAIPALYQAGGEWDHYINERAVFYNALLEDNYEEAQSILANFWRNLLSPIVKEYAKYDQIMNNETEFIDRFVTRVSKNYLVWKELFKADVKELRVPNVGNQWGLQIEGELVVPKACRYHAHCQQVKNLTVDIEGPVFAEIGAGYCGMANYMLRDIPGLTYVDFDLPETLVIGAYYIMSAHPDKKVLLYGEYEDLSKVNIKDYDAIFLANFELPNFPANSVDVFYNSFSLSEMPKATSTEYLKQVAKICRQYFLHNNMDRKGVINRGFERTPASEFAIDEKVFKNIYKQFDLFHGHDGDYKEFLYEKRKN